VKLIPGPNGLIRDLELDGSEQGVDVALIIEHGDFVRYRDLFSAAPELLAFVEDCLEEFLDTDVYWTHDLIVEAKALIAKAKGTRP
jgi:hypothetical protein